MELPQYTLKPNVNRMVAPWILKLLCLAALFYGGIYFNVKYAMGKEIPPIINMLIFAFLIVLVVTQIILYNVRFGKYNYKFYTNRVEYEAKKLETFMFSDFQEAVVQQHMFDKMFGTGIIKLSKTFSIGPISNVDQMRNYLSQLVQYYRYSQERYKAQQQQAAMQQQMAAQQYPQTAQQQAPSSFTQAQPALQASSQPQQQAYQGQVNPR